MKQCISLFVLGFVSLNIQAQFIWGGGSSGSFKAFDNSSSYAKSQIWLGVKGGTNLSWAQATTKYQIYEQLPGATEFNYSKTYESVQFPGYQFGLLAIYNFRSFFSVIFEPAFSSQSFAYKSTYTWRSDNPLSSIQLDQRVSYQLQYFDLPLYFRMDIYKGVWRPYIIGGATYSMLTNASRKSTYTSTDQITGAQNSIENPVPEAGVKNQFLTSHFSYSAGIGISRDLQNIRVGLNALFKGSFHTITNQKNRYSDQRINATGDVLDDVWMRNIEITAFVVFPLKFLVSPGYNRVDP